MPIRRVFLGYNSAAVVAAADWLARVYERDGLLDLSRLILVTPGRRAGRRLFELLATRSGGFRSPLSTTVGHLPELLYQPEQPLADDLRARLAWLAALKDGDARTRSVIFPHPPAPDDLAGWLALADELAGLHESLAADNLCCGALPGRTGLPGGEPGRWEALGRIEDAYLALLAASGLADTHASRRRALKHGGIALPEERDAVVLLGVADQSPQLREYLLQVAQNADVIALIHAPESEAEAFDECGGLVVESWAERGVDLDRARLELVDGPRDQAYAILDAIRAGKAESPDQVTVGLGDESLAPMIARSLDLAGVPAHPAAGMSLSETRPLLFLAALAAYAREHLFADFATLVRHPDVEAWINRQLDPDGDLKPGQWLADLDQDYGDCLLQRLDGPWPRSGGRVIRRLHGLIGRLLTDTAQPRPLAAWSEPLAGLLDAIYGQARLQRYAEADRPVCEALRALGQSLATLAQLPPGPLAPHLSLAEAITLIAHGLAVRRIPAEGGDAAVELLGWLELQLDDAPHLVVTTFNEHHIPAGHAGDPFLPDSVRERAGLRSNRRTFARDVMMLTAIVASRPDVTLISCRRAANHEPLVPSRLFFACPDDELVTRARAFYAGETAPAAPALFSPGPVSLFRVPRPVGGGLEEMRVTALGDYLACPYRFYLKHVLRLETASDDAAELDALGFGILAHAVLKRFGEDEAERDRADAEAVRRFLERTLADEVAARFGAAPPPAVAIQVEILRERLRAFATWQAAQATAGWRIHRVETDVAGDWPLAEGSIRLKGRIDRIDVHRDGRCRILDYKTGNEPVTPDKKHRRGRSGAKEWADFQLPLYRRLAESLSLPGPVALGYVVLPRDSDWVGELMAEWNDAELDEAYAAATGILERVRAGAFWPPAEPQEDEFAAICLDEYIGRDRSIASGES